MRDPAARIDPDLEAAIEETRRFLEPRVRSPEWKADLAAALTPQLRGTIGQPEFKVAAALMAATST